MNNIKFINEFSKNWKKIIISLIVIFIFLFSIQYFILKKDPYMSALHGFLISTLITVV